MVNNITTCLLVYEEILRNGFDGLYFIEGLIGHLRGLLVSQDAETVMLLEGPPSMQEKYKLQAEQTSISFLLEALRVTNQCAIQYKDSINKRFHVELTLIELAKHKHISYAENATLMPISSSTTLEKSTSKEIDNRPTCYYNKKTAACRTSNKYHSSKKR